MLAELAAIVSPDVQENIFRLVPPAKYVRDQVLFYRDHLPYGVFVIRSGKVMLEEGRRKKNGSVLGGGYAIGMTLVENALPYSCTGKVLEDSYISFINRTLLKKIQKNNSLLFKQKGTFLSC